MHPLISSQNQAEPLTAAAAGVFGNGQPTHASVLMYPPSHRGQRHAGVFHFRASGKSKAQYSRKLLVVALPAGSSEKDAAIGCVFGRFGIQACSPMQCHAQQLTFGPDAPEPIDKLVRVINSIIPRPLTLPQELDIGTNNRPPAIAVQMSKQVGLVSDSKQQSFIKATYLLLPGAPFQGRIVETVHLFYRVDFTTEAVQTPFVIVPADAPGELDAHYDAVRRKLTPTPRLERLLEDPLREAQPPQVMHVGETLMISTKEMLKTALGHVEMQ